MRVGVTFFPIPPGPEMIRLAQVADELGFDDFLVGDSHMIWRELNVLLGAIAHATKRITIGPGVTHPLVRHLTVTASAVATLGELAPRRVRLGIGVGSSGPATIGVRRGGARELERAVQTIRALLRGESVELEGRSVRLAYTSGEVAPVLMAGNSPFTLRAAGRTADGSICSGPVDTLATAAATLKEGDPARTVPLTWTCPCAVGEDSAAARQAVKPVMARTALVWLTRASKYGGLEPIDREPFERLQRAYDPYKHMSDAYTHLVEDRWVERLSLAGTPEEVLAGCRRAAEAGADGLYLSLHGASLEDQLRRFAEGVLQPLRAGLNS